MGIEKHYTLSMNMGCGSIASLSQKRVLHAKFILASCAEIEKKPDLSSSILNTNALAIKRHCKGSFCLLRDSGYTSIIRSACSFCKLSQALVLIMNNWH